ncbi:MAG: hypothetical protein MUE85_24385 [Microscillaceae bacterium]|jgi:hypothetical protein|nr:hypothetical protein [Microscillaceae bacterium]
MNIHNWLTYYNLKLEVYFKEILPAQFNWDFLSNEIDNYNNLSSINELPDYLNPDCVDKNKVQVFLEKLPVCPYEIVNHLKNRVIYLRNPNLGLGQGLPFEADLWQKSMQFYWQADEPQELFRLGIKVDFDLAQAQQLAQEAQQKYEDAQNKLSQLEIILAQTEESPELGDILIQKSNWQSIKFALAQVWRNNQQLINDKSPSTLVSLALSKAQAACDESLVVPNLGMPNF